MNILFKVTETNEKRKKNEDPTNNMKKHIRNKEQKKEC